MPPRRVASTVSKRYCSDAEKLLLAAKQPFALVYYDPTTLKYTLRTNLDPAPLSVVLSLVQDQVTAALGEQTGKAKP